MRSPDVRESVGVAQCAGTPIKALQRLRFVKHGLPRVQCFTLLGVQ